VLSGKGGFPQYWEEQRSSRWEPSQLSGLPWTEALGLSQKKNDFWRRGKDTPH
jgi:hypothetical protein